jgi:predicted DCC family thiol-disulfide oxidoreductase YuxK
MRRLLTGPIAYLAELGGAAARGWNAFFFTPADPTALGLVRIVVGLLLMRSLFVLGLDLPGFLGSHAWADAEAVRSWMAEFKPHSWSFWLWVPDALLRPVWVGCLVILAMFTIGLFSRTTAVLAWVITVSTARRSPVILYGFDQIVSTWALYLAVGGACGQAVSLDRFLSRWRATRKVLARRPRQGEPWPIPPGVPARTISANLSLRLIQLHLCLIYGMSALAKFRGDAWWNGFAIWGVLASAEFRRFDLTWMASYPRLLNLLTHGGLFLELSYPALIWVPILRPLVLALVVMMHLGIDLSLGLTEFALAMLAGNLAFVSGPWLRSLAAGRDDGKPYGILLYDGACPRCRKWMTPIMAADPASVVTPVDFNVVDVTTIHPRLTREGCLAAMHLVTREGRVTAGFDAATQLGRWLPLFWPLGLIASLPGVALVGRRAYNALAASRPRETPCSDETCALPTPTATRPAAQPRADAAGRPPR